MIRLLVGDVREHWHAWFGVLAVATAFGYMGGWFASFSACLLYTSPSPRD